MRVLRPGLLEGKVLLLAGRPGAGEVVREAFTELGAEVRACEPHPTEEAALDEAVEAVMAETGRIDLLVLDGGSLFADLPRPGSAAAPTAPTGSIAHAALRACLDGAWNVTRAVINHAFLPQERGGRIVYVAPAADAGLYVAPAADAGELAETARAALENLARTLSVEWARHGVNVVSIAPGASTAAGEVAALCAYLASPAGAYFSGCQFDLRGV